MKQIIALFMLITALFATNLVAAETSATKKLQILHPPLASEITASTIMLLDGELAYALNIKGGMFVHYNATLEGKMKKFDVVINKQWVAGFPGGLGKEEFRREIVLDEWEKFFRENVALSPIRYIPSQFFKMKDDTEYELIGPSGGNGLGVLSYCRVGDNKVQEVARKKLGVHNLPKKFQLAEKDGLLYPVEAIIGQDGTTNLVVRVLK